MCDQLDVFVGNFTLIDWDVFRLWLNGHTASEAVQILKENGDVGDDEDFSREMLMSDVNDHYRLYSMLETAILQHNDVDRCFSQFLLPDESETKRCLIESYYSLDSQLCREMVGRKLNSRLRKDLDEMCDNKCVVRLRSARRQYDNVKRVYKAIEELAGDYVTNIVDQFGLSRRLAEKYATLVFASSFRLEVAKKKKLNYLTFENIMNVTLILIDDWVVTTTTTTTEDDPQEPALDKDYLANLRELRTLQDRDKEHRAVVCHRLQSRCLGSGSNQKVRLELENNFRSLSRGIVSVATGLSHNKEVKDFLVQLVEKVVEPLRSIGVDRADVDVFLTQYTSSIVAADDTEGEKTMPVDNDTKVLFARFMKVLRPAVLIIYP